MKRPNREAIIRKPRHDCHDGRSRIRIAPECAASRPEPRRNMAETKPGYDKVIHIQGDSPEHRSQGGG
jgi:hypothetical protein